MFSETPSGSSSRGRVVVLNAMGRRKLGRLATDSRSALRAEADNQHPHGPTATGSEASKAEERGVLGSAQPPEEPLNQGVLARFWYHLRFAVEVPMQTTSGRPSPLRSSMAQPAAAMSPSSIGCFDHDSATGSSLV